MKKKLCLLIACLFVVLCACGGEEYSATREVTYEGKTYTVYQDPARPAGTITVDGYTCEYAISGGSSSVKMEITYPDGSTYWWEQRSNGTFRTGSGGWSDDYTPVWHMRGEVLWEVLNLDVETDRDSGESPLLGLLIIALGIWNVAAPRSAWYLSHGWRYKNAEPSDAALLFGRLGGIAAILIGILAIFI